MTVLAGQAHHGEVPAVRPLPETGSIFLDARGTDRALRVTWHHESGLVVLSLCRENVVFMALSADTTPHFTTIADFIATLCARVKDASAARTPLRLRGGGTKDFYGGALRGDVVEMAPCSGIVAYEPRELVLTVRAGTPLGEVESALAAERQMLPFEPPHFGGAATIGGVVAAGLSGPARAPLVTEG